MNRLNFLSKQKLLNLISVSYKLDLICLMALNYNFIFGVKKCPSNSPQTLITLIKEK